jgi:hypothetical protein
VEVSVPQHKRSQRGKAVALACAAFVVGVAVVWAVAATKHSYREGTPTTAASYSSPSANAVIPHIDTLLLGPDEIDHVMGTVDMLSDDDVLTHLFQSNTKFEPAECRGVVTSGAPMQFGHTGYIAVREQSMEGAGAIAGEDALQYATADAARDVVDSLAASWQACRGKSITKTIATAQLHEVIQEVATGRHKLSARFAIPDHPVAHYSCERVAEPVSVYVIDVIACGSYLTDEADVIASRIAAKITI